MEHLQEQKKLLSQIANLVISENNQENWMIYANAIGTDHLLEDWTGTQLSTVQEVESHLDTLIQNHNPETGLVIDVARSRAIAGNLELADRGESIDWVTISFIKTSLYIEDESMGGKSALIEDYTASKLDSVKKALINETFPSGLNYVSWGAGL